MTILEIDAVGYQYRGGAWGIHNVTLDLSGKGILGLVGPLGAGKTTLLNVLASVSVPTEGEIRWHGIDVQRQLGEYRRVLGYVPENCGSYDRLTARAFLRYMAALRLIDRRLAPKRVEQVLDLVGLAENASMRLDRCSVDLKWRVVLAQALLAPPQLVLVDLPSDDVSSEQRSVADRGFWERIQSFLGQDALIVIASENILDVADSASHLALMVGGHLVKQVTPVELLSLVPQTVWHAVVGQNDLVQLKRRYLISDAQRQQGGIGVRIVSQDQPILSAAPVEPTITDAYVYFLTQEQKAQQNGGL